MTDSPNIGLPLMEAAQAQKHITHNEALILLDALTQISVADMSANAPPSAPLAGLRVVVGPSPTGAFAGQSGKIALYDQGIWRFLTPREGWQVWSSSAASAFVYSGAAWVKFTDLLGAIQNLGQLGVGTQADAANPFSFRGANALFTARYAANGGDGALRFKLNKENNTATVSQLYQTNWSGRAETGLIGDNLWSVRRSMMAQHGRRRSLSTRGRCVFSMDLSLVPDLRSQGRLRQAFCELPMGRCAPPLQVRKSGGARRLAFSQCRRRRSSETIQATADG